MGRRRAMTENEKAGVGAVLDSEGEREREARAPRVPTEKGPPIPGTLVEAVWGEEAFSPVQYHSFRVGPFRASRPLREGETVAEATADLLRDLGRAAEAERKRKAENFLRVANETKTRG